MTIESVTNKVTTRTFRICPWNDFSDKCTWLALMSQTHMSNHFFLPASHLPFSHLCLIQVIGSKHLNPEMCRPTEHCWN